MIEFEWDIAKDRLNRKKHGVSFEEAKSVFYDDFAIQFFDEENSVEKDRFLMLGYSNESRMLMICHCERNSGQSIRIISARRPTASEREYYKGGH